MNQLVASPLLGRYALSCHGELDAFELARDEYDQLRSSRGGLNVCPDVLEEAKSRWPSVFEFDSPRLIVREPELAFARASWEITELCNYDCEHCYLGKKIDRSLGWPDRERIMDYLDKSGILFLQMTGGEALADPLFCETYSTAWNRGILISLSTNGSRLSNSTILKTLCDRPPQRITISVYGASEATYDALTLRPGSFRKFIRGLEAVKNAGLRVRLNIIVTTHNQHERHEMVKLAESFGFENHVFDEMTPTIYGGDEPMLFQATDVGVKDRTFTGCNAGKTFYHVDQTGHAMVCKVGRKPYIDLLGEGVGSLLRLNPISDQLLDESGMPQSHKGRICAPQSRQRTFEPKRAEIKLMLRVI